MKDLLTNDRIDLFISRLNNLNPNQQPSWGSLSVNGMLHHCIIVTNAIITSTETRKAKFKEVILTPVFYGIRRLPRNFQSGAKYLASDQDILEFERERAMFADILISLKDRSRMLMGVHPVFGPLNTNKWRKFLLLHTDHHLRQFNV